MADKPRWVAVGFALVATALARRPKLLYVPFGILAGRVASKVAGGIFTRMWRFLAGETALGGAALRRSARR